MVEKILVVVIVVIVVWALVRNFYRTLTGKNDGCDQACGNCQKYKEGKDCH